MVVAFAGTFIFVSRISAVLYFFEAVFAGKISSVMAASGFCRAFNFLVRWLVARDTSLNVHVSSVNSMVVLSFASVSIRRIILDESSRNPTALVVNCLRLALMEALGRSVSYLAHFMLIAKDMKHMNSMTLCDLVDVHTRVKRHVDGILAFLFVDQFVEIFVSVMITTQDLSAPIWSYIRVWMSEEAWDARFSFILLEGATQVGVEFLVDLLIWRLCFHRLGWDLPHVTRSVLLNKTVAGFTMGLMLMHSLNFFPNCMNCR